MFPLCNIFGLSLETLIMLDQTEKFYHVQNKSKLLFHQIHHARMKIYNPIE